MQAVIYRKLSELVDNYKQERHTHRETWVKRFFEALDWGKRPTFSIENDGTYGYRLTVDSFPVVNILPESPNNIDKVYRALNRAYNQDVPWLVATDFKSLGLYGSYWYSFPHDISSALALQVEHTDYLADAHRLEVLTPQDVAANSLNQIYTSIPGKKKRLRIDIHLVERMAEWRKLALDALGSSAVDSDFLIHRLINTLFLTRYLEDIGGTSPPLLLSEVAKIENEELLRNKLLQVMNYVSEQTGYNVPTAAEFKGLIQSPMRTLLNELYGYPEWGVVYDFSAMNVDILGRFYEEYLRLSVVPTQQRRAALSLFEPQAFQYDNIRRQQGIYFTPRFIVDYILNSLVGRFKANHTKDQLPYVFDLAAGSGTFLTAAVDHFVRAYPKANKDTHSLIEHIGGLDIDPRATEAASLNLRVRLLAHKVAIPFPPLKLRTADLIFGGPSQNTISELLPAEGADIIVGNPPYIKYEELVKQYDVEIVTSHFDTAKGRTDSYILFVEAALKLLKPGGFAGLVVPSSILRTQVAGPLRQWLTKNADLLEIIDFMDQTVFQGVSVYICLLLFRKRSDNPISLKVTVAKIYQLSDTPASQLAHISVAQEGPQDGCEAFRMDQPTGLAPWETRNRAELEILGILQDASSQTVKDVLHLRQGVKTGSDNVFVVEATALNDEFYLIHGKNEHNMIERDLLIPVFRNRDLRRWLATPSCYLLYPYDQSRQQILDWSTLESKYPRGAAYLNSFKEYLSKRKSLRTRPWYGLIEPRVQTIFSNDKRLFVSELSLRPIFFQTSTPQAAIVGNAYLFLSDESYDLQVIMAYLNSDIAEWFLRQVSPILQRGYILLRQSNLSRLPLPKFLRESDSFVYSELKRLSNQLSIANQQVNSPRDSELRREVEAYEDQINTLIFQALGLKAYQADTIRETVTFARGGSSYAQSTQKLV